MTSQNQTRPELLMSKEQLLYETHDNKDPISQTDIWIEENNKRTVVYPKDKYDDIRFYYERPDILRCFEIQSLEFLKTHNIFTHPISKEPIPLFMFDDINCIEPDNNDITINKIASDTFELLNNVFIFIDCELFLSLHKDDLLNFYYELHSLWSNNLSIAQIHDIAQNRTLFDKTTSDLSNRNMIDIQRYILNQMKPILEYTGEHKFMICNIIIAALGIVIPEVNSEYYEYDFII